MKRDGRTGTIHLADASADAAAQTPVALVPAAASLPLFPLFFVAVAAGLTVWFLTRMFDKESP